MTPANIYITDHALARWRERVAAYGDAGPDEIVAAVRVAVPVPPGDPLPLPARRANSRYYRHRDRPSVYLVTDMRPDGEAVVTVIETERPAPPAEPGPEPGPEPKPKPEPAAVVGFIPLPPLPPRLPARGEPLPDEPDDFPDAGARRDWLVAQQRELEGVLRGLRREDPERVVAQSRFREVTRRLTETREDYREWLAARDLAGDTLYRDDGRVNFEPAIRHLLAEVARLSAEVARLSAAADDNVRLQTLALALADRVSAQSEILARRAGRGEDV